MKIRTLVVTIKGDDLRAVEALEERFSDAVTTVIMNEGAEPRHDKNGELTGVVDLWGCVVQII